MSISSDPKRRVPLLVYYGFGRLDALACAERAALQPDHYTTEELATLRMAGVRPLAYLSLSEDTGPEAPWQRRARNPDWGGAYVDVAHPDWVTRCLEEARRARERGFEGLLLDTLDLMDAPAALPQDRLALLTLIGRLRAAWPGAYLLANRGAALLPELTGTVDGVLFESFSCCWTDQGPRWLSRSELRWTRAWALRVRRSGLDGFALDYAADRPDLARRARVRARRFGLPCQVANRELDTL